MSCVRKVGRRWAHDLILKAILESERERKRNIHNKQCSVNNMRDKNSVRAFMKWGQ